MSVFLEMKQLTDIVSYVISPGQHVSPGSGASNPVVLTHYKLNGCLSRCSMHDEVEPTPMGRHFSFHAIYSDSAC